HARPRASDGNRRAFRHVAQRRLQAPQGARVGRAYPPRSRRERSRHRVSRSAAARSLDLGAPLRTLLDAGTRQTGALLQGEEEQMTERIRTYELTLNRTLAASPEEVYDAWLDPNLPCNPWHGSKRLDWNPRVGGLWYFLHLTTSKGWPPERPHFGRFAV